MRKVCVSKGVIAITKAAAVAALTVACAEQNPVAPAGSTGLSGPAQTAVTAHCPDHQTEIKIEELPVSFTAPSGQVVSGVCIKAGRQIFRLGPNATDGCYTTVTTGGVTTVTGGGTGKECKDIGYVVFYTALAALPITYNFSGVMTTVNPPFAGPSVPSPVLAVGDPWSLMVTTDPTAVFFSSPSLVEYSASGSWTLGTFAGTMTGWVTVSTNPLSGGNTGLYFSTFSVPTMTNGTISPGTIGGVPVTQLAVFTTGPPSGSTDLPTSVANFSGRFELGLFNRPSLANIGSVTSITVATMPTPIP